MSILQDTYREPLLFQEEEIDRSCLLDDCCLPRSANVATCAAPRNPSLTPFNDSSIRDNNPRYYRFSAPILIPSLTVKVRALRRPSGHVTFLGNIARLVSIRHLALLIGLIKLSTFIANHRHVAAPRPSNPCVFSVAFATNNVSGHVTVSGRENVRKSSVLIPLTV